MSWDVRKSMCTECGDVFEWRDDPIRAFQDHALDRHAEHPDPWNLVGVNLNFAASSVGEPGTNE